MGAIYTGLISTNGYVFTTNDTLGVGDDRSAIAKLNDFCGAFIVTARGKFLLRVRDLLDKCLSDLNGLEEGISMDLAQEIVQSFEMEFQNEPVFKENPLPFLLLLVGYSSRQPSFLEHIFVRNRVVEIIEKDGEKQYITDFEIESPVPAKHLFYGHAEVTQYLSQLLSANNFDLETMKLFAYLSLTQTQKTDDSLFADIRIATISEDKGFEWVRREELDRLSLMADAVDRTFSEGLSGLLSSPGNFVEK